MLFTDEILEKILTREDVSKVPLVYQSAMIHAIKEVLEEENVSDAKSEYGTFVIMPAHASGIDSP